MVVTWFFLNNYYFLLHILSHDLLLLKSHDSISGAITLTSPATRGLKMALIIITHDPLCASLHMCKHWPIIFQIFLRGTKQMRNTCSRGWLPLVTTMHTEDQGQG